MTASEQSGIRRFGGGGPPLQLRLLRDPAMTEHIGGPETAEAIECRHERYLAMTDPVDGMMSAVVLVPAGKDEPAGLPDLAVARVAASGRSR